MLYTIIRGAKHRLARGEVAEKNLASIWKGLPDGSMKRIWPDQNTAYSIYVEYPRWGSIDWAYWQHALYSLAHYECNRGNYMRFTIDGLDYYLQKSFDGTQPYIVKGNRLFLGNGFDGASVKKLGQYLNVNVCIPHKEIWYTQWEDSDKGIPNRTPGDILTQGAISEDEYFYLPYINGTMASLRFYKGKKNKRFVIDTTISSYPGEQPLFTWHFETKQHKRKWFGYDFQPMTEDIYWDGEEKYQKGMAKMYDPSQCMRIHQVFNGFTNEVQTGLRFPPFTRTFKLKILSINNAI